MMDPAADARAESPVAGSKLLTLKCITGGRRSSDSRLSSSDISQKGDAISIRFTLFV
jgi:hypothetical protein